jgi:hypothetical protein
MYVHAIVTIQTNNVQHQFVLDKTPHPYLLVLDMVLVLRLTTVTANLENILVLTANILSAIILHQMIILYVQMEMVHVLRQIIVNAKMDGQVLLVNMLFVTLFLQMIHQYVLTMDLV